MPALKGYQRRLVMLPTRDSTLYETACFIMKGDAEARAPSKGEMLSEAMRILEANAMVKKPRVFGTRHLVFACVGGFLLGALAVAMALLFRMM
jgi:hypothetical protein